MHTFLPILFIFLLPTLFCGITLGAAWMKQTQRKERGPIQQYAIVELRKPCEADYPEQLVDTQLYFLGRIPNKVGHCLVIGGDMRLYDIHTEDLRELTMDEV